MKLVTYQVDQNRNYQRRRGVGISDGFHWCGVSDDAGGSKADV